MDIVQSFYDKLAGSYDKLFQDWSASTREQAAILDRIIVGSGFQKNARILDCACGIGTQAIGLALLGYNLTGSDISDNALAEARERARGNGVQIDFVHADFRKLAACFPGKFEVILAMDNALPHMLTEEDLELAVKGIIDQLEPGGMLIASIRDYDQLLESRPPYSPPYIHRTEKGQRVCLQTWEWNGDSYRLVQYIIEDEGEPQIEKFECQYRAVRRRDLAKMLLANGCREAAWMMPSETGFYQPIVVARKR